MPGGEDYRRWYAMRARLIKEGKWKHRVPQQEEGEPEPKRHEGEEDAPGAADSNGGSDAPEASTPDSLPPLEDPPTAEGNDVVWLWIQYTGLGQGIEYASNEPQRSVSSR